MERAVALAGAMAIVGAVAPNVLLVGPHGFRQVIIVVTAIASLALLTRRVRAT